MSSSLDNAARDTSHRRPSLAAWIGIAGVVVIAALLAWSLVMADAHGGHDGDAAVQVDADAPHTAPSEADHGETNAKADDGHGAKHLPRLYGVGVLPFIGILLCIAFLPLLRWTHHWWESNVNRLCVSAVCALLTIAYYLAIDRAGLDGVGGRLEHAILIEYIPFMVLLFSLYVISGGIVLRGDLAAKPLTNTAFLAIGAAMASFIGTTGASMLLIRPLLKTNHERRHVVHTIVFFIFLVSNIGGSLLPIGDPPLFLGYLRGVDFFWTLSLWPQWAMCSVLLLVVYFVLDTLAYRNESDSAVKIDRATRVPLRLRGGLNFVWLLGVVLCVIFIQEGKPLPVLGWTAFPFLRELAMLVLVGVALLTTPEELRRENRFTYAAIIEVAAIFLGIFVAMQVPVQVLQVLGGEFGVTEPWQYFWFTGSLSSFLDNAPTYVVFFETASAVTPEPLEETVIRPDLLTGISLGAVFMGAMTYIGNGPNFMVRSIAEQSGVRMPSFFGYMLKYSIPVLLPVFIIITLVFFRHT